MKIYTVFSIQNILPIAFSLVIWIPFFAIGMFIIKSLSEERKERKKDGSKDKKSFYEHYEYFIIYTISIGFIIGGAYIGGSTALTVADKVVNIVAPYVNEDYKTVSGKVENLNIDEDNYNREIEFTVEDVYFHFSPYDLTDVGLNNLNIISKDKNINIKYIYDETEKQNVILEITS